MSQNYLIWASVKQRNPAVVEVIAGSDGVLILLEYDAETGILRAFGEALREHARCAGCGGPLRDDFSKCACDISRNVFSLGDYEAGRVLRVENGVWRDVLAPLWKKDRRRVYSIVNGERRALAIKASDEPNYTKNDKACLRKAQNDACYYCGASIARGAHVDHLDPLARGGSNGFANIMLACASCNISKHATTEQQFWRKLRKQLPADEFDRRRTAAKEMKKAKWRCQRDGLRNTRKRSFQI